MTVWDKFPRTVPVDRPVPVGDPSIYMDLPREHPDKGHAVPVYIPFPQTPPPSGVVIPFPDKTPPIPPGATGAAILGRILLGGAIGTVAIEVIRHSRKAIQRKEQEEKRQEAENIMEDIRRDAERIAREKHVKVETERAISRGNVDIETYPPPEFPTAPTRVPLPELEPFPVTLPTPTVPTPSPQPVPVEIPAPLPVPAPVATPAPAKSPAPSRAPLPGAWPGIFPGRLPAFFPLPGIRPGTRFGIRTGDLVPQRFTPSTQAPLTGFNAGVVPFTGQQPQPDQAEDRCKEVQRRRRRKGKCHEGFYREYPNKTQYTEWREVDCITRAETRRSKLKRRGFDVEDVLSFP